MSNGDDIYDTEGSSDVDSQTRGIYTNLIVGVVTIVVCSLLFEFLRRKVPSIYEARRIMNERHDPLDYYEQPVYAPPSPSSAPFGWLLSIFEFNLDSVSETHGYDAALFLRFLRTMMFLFAGLLVPFVALMAVYGTGENKDAPKGDPVRTIGVQRFSLSNLSTDDPWRFWIALVADYAITIFTCYIINREFTIYVRYRVRYRASRNPANYTILVQDVPKNADSVAVQHYWNRLFPTHISQSHYVYNAKPIVDKMQKFWKAVSSRERAEWEYANNPKLEGDRPTHKPGACSCIKPNSSKVDSINYWASRQRHYSSKIRLYQQDKQHAHAKPTHTAFVVFKDRRSAAAAAQTNYAESSGEWTVSWAPEPNAVNWSSLGIPVSQTLIRTTLTIVASLALTILWIIPVSFIMGLANLRELSDTQIGGSRPFKFLAGIKEWDPVTLGIIEGFLPPVILSVFLGLVPTFLRIFVSFQRVPSLAVLDRRVRDWYFNFVVFSNFLFVLASGSLLTQLPAIAQKPTQLAEFLASSAPRQGAFITNFVLLKALAETPKEIIQIGRLVIRFIMIKFVAKTKRQRQNAEVGNSEFSYLRYYAMAQLIVLLGFIYCTIAPYIIPACFLYFLVMFVVWKYNLCYSMWNVYGSGGDFYGGALYGVWTGLFLHLITMIGIFGLNKNPAQSVLIVIPAAAMIAFLIHLLSTYTRIAEHGSSLTVMRQTEEMNGEDHIPDEIAEKYIHPGMVPLPDPIENLSGVDSKSGFVTGETDEEQGGHSKHDPDVEDPNEFEKVQDMSGHLDNGNTKSDEVWVDAYNGYNDKTTS